MKRFLTSSVLAGALWLFPSVGNASTIGFTIGANSSDESGTTTYNSSASVGSQAAGASVVFGVNSATHWATLLIDGTTSISGVFTETYTYIKGSSANNGTATLTLVDTTANGGPFTSGTTLLTITETGVTNPFAASNNSPSAVDLYSGTTTLNFNSATFASEIGVPQTPSSALVASANFSVTDGTTAGVVSSESANMTFTPEPASFGMFGLALMSGIVVTARRKLQLRRSQN